MGLLFPPPNEAELSDTPFIISTPFCWILGQGVVVNHSDSVINDSGLLFNYDKINKQLAATRDGQSFLYTDREDVKSFTLYTPTGHLAFYRVSEISSNNFYLLIAAGKTCTVYKKITPDVKRLPCFTDGVVEYATKNRMVEDVGKATYYITNVSGKSKFSAKFYLTKKSIKQAFGFDQEKLDVFFNAKQRT